MILDRFFLTRSRFWELVDNGREDFFFPPLPLQDIIIIIIILPVRGYRGYSTRLKKEKQILDNNLKINNSIARRDYSISKYSIDIVTYHFEEWKKCRITFLSLEIETFFVVDPRNGGFGTSCNRNERKCVSFEKRKEYIVFAIRDERGKEWGDDERRRDERGKERGVRTIEDHRSRIRSLLSILGCKWINRYIRCND